MTVEYGLDYLHTASHYIKSAPSSFTQQSMSRTNLEALMHLYDEAINNMELKEQQFFNSLGFNNIQAFFNFIKNNLKSTDLNILSNFNASSLNANIKNYNIFRDLTKQPVTIQLDVHNLRKGIDLLPFLESLGAEGIIETNGIVTFDIIFSISTAKKLIDSARRQGQFKMDKKNENKATDAFVEQMRNGKLIQVFPTGSQPINERERLSFRGSDFNYSVEEIRAMNKTQISSIVARMKEYIFDSLGINKGSSTLQEAANIMWDSLLYTRVQQDIASEQNQAEFFAGGGGLTKNSWLSNTKGALGEFQTGVFYQYLNLKLNKPAAQRIATITGSDVNVYKEQLHTDVQILDSFGIQVKNYNGAEMFNRKTQTMENKTITVRLHPSQIPSIASDQEVMGYIINAGFNSDIQVNISEEQWSNFFESIAPEVLNLDYHMNSNISDKITVYHVSGYFIPGSAILKMARQNMIQRFAQQEDFTVRKTTISMKQARSDEEFLNPKDKPLFLEWWHEQKGGNWEPQAKNNISAWDNKVSIQTTFEYKTLLLDEYRLF